MQKAFEGWVIPLFYMLTAEQKPTSLNAELEKLNSSLSNLV